MNIHGVASSYGTRLEPSKGRGVDVSRSGEAVRGDRLELSGEARSQDPGGASAALLRAQALPEVREDRMDEVRQRLESGYYNAPEFDAELARGLIRNRMA